MRGQAPALRIGTGLPGPGISPKPRGGRPQQPGEVRPPHSTEFIEQLRAVWDTRPDLSSMDIAFMFDITKNQLIGLANRRGFKKRASPITGSSIATGPLKGAAELAAAKEASARARKGRFPKHVWTRAQDDLIDGFRAAGEPWEAIAQALGVGLTLLFEHVAARQKAVAEPIAEAPMVQEPKPAPKPVQPALAGVSVSFHKTCCFPLWGSHERPTHKYCDAATVGGSSYCAKCYRRTHERAQGRSE